MREKSSGSVSLLKTRLGRSPLSTLPESGSSKGEVLWTVNMILLRATAGNGGGDSAQLRGHTAVVQRQDFITVIITEDHVNCGCFQQVGREAVVVVLEPSAMPS